VANLLDVHRGKLAMGLVFAGDAYLGREGRLREDLPPTREVLALARLYGATAHLVVSRESAIRTVMELRGRRVAIGSAGSGSAQAARRFFENIGMWGSIIPLHEGYAVGMEDMRQGNVDAVWLQVGYPSQYLLEIGQKMPLRLIDLYDSALVAGFFSAFPFYAYASIPAGTYRGQQQDIITFQDAALWVAGPALSEEFVYRALQTLFSEKEMERMHTIRPAWDFDIAKGLMGVKIPLHPGAERFWKGQGISLPPPQQR
jgi:TRAP transporter TAXI family solute receptor